MPDHQTPVNPNGAEHQLVDIAADTIQQQEGDRSGLLRLVKSGEYEKVVQMAPYGPAGMEMGLQRVEGAAICDAGGLEGATAVYTNLQSAPKKRKLSQDMAFVKSEPGNFLIIFLV